MRVGVVGAGLQSAGIAIELARRGVTVDLFEKRSSGMTQASLHNEGKIHLGFVYANDPTLQTARLLAAGALQFESILREWLDMDLAACPVSAPFHYIVHRDSLLSPDALAAYYASVTAMIGGNARCFGHNAGAPVRRLLGSEAASISDSEKVSAVFQTPEIAIDPAYVARLVMARVEADPRIRLHTGATVTRAVPGPDSVMLELERAEGREARHYNHVVNASWEDLLAIDATAGVHPLGAWSFRVKHFLRVQAGRSALRLPSATIVLGAFGDVVNYGQDEMFLSWYPVGRRGIAHTLKPPPWPTELDPSAAAQVRAGTFEALSQILPGLSCLQPVIPTSKVNGGIIYGLGVTDVHDRTSRLHERYSVGPRSFGRYHTVNTGKYTVAPLFARQTANRIMEQPNGRH